MLLRTLVVCSLLYLACAEQEIYVSPSGNNTNGCGTPDQPCRTIEVGVIRAEANDTVVVMEGLYSVDVIIQIFKPLTLRGENASIVCGQASTGFFLSADILLEGFTISNCSERGIVTEGRNTTIRNCSFHQNQGTLGGSAIYMYSNETRSLAIQNCNFTENISGPGGAVYAHARGQEGLLLIENCIFLRNQGSEGGGIDVESQLTIIRNCIFDSNSATSYGGGATVVTGANLIYNAHPAVFIDRCQFYENRVMGRLTSGAGLYIGGPFDALVTESTFYHNSMTKNGSLPGGGGGAYVANVNSVNFINSTFSNNTCYMVTGSSIGGAGLAVTSSGSVIVDDCVFSGNYVLGAATLYGTHMIVSGARSATLQRITFQGDQTSMKLGSMVLLGNLFGIQCLDSVVVKDCQFLNNTLTGYTQSNNTLVQGGMFLFQANQVTLANCTFSNNLARFEPSFYQLELTGGVVSISLAVEILVSNCTFVSNEVRTTTTSSPYFISTGTLAIYSVMLQHATVEHSSFISNSISIGSSVAGLVAPLGAALYANIFMEESSNLTVRQCLFDSNSVVLQDDLNPTSKLTAFGGGAVAIVSNLTIITVQESQFTRNSLIYDGLTGAAKGAGLYATGLQLTVDSCLFSENVESVTNTFCIDNDAMSSGSAVYTAAPYSVISNSSFHSNIAALSCATGSGSIAEGAGYFSQGFSDFYNVTFFNNSASGLVARGGAARGRFFRATGCQFLQNQCTSAKLSFSDVFDSVGGALYTSMIVLTNSTFRGNSAPFGGALAVPSLSSEDFFDGVEYIENVATVGGGLFIEQQSSYLSENSFGTFIDNQATYYGAGAATLAHDLVAERTTAVAYPGEVFTLIFVLQDCFTNPIGWGGYRLNINKDQDSQFLTDVPGNVLENTPDAPYYEINSAYFIGPAQNDTIHTVEFTINGPVDVGIFSVTVNFTLATCIPGTIYNIESAVCSPCAPQTFSFDASTCVDCPADGACMSTYNSSNPLDGKFVTVLGPGVWPQPSFTAPNTVIPCPIPQACIELHCSTVLGPDGFSWFVDCNTQNYTFVSGTEASPYCEEGYTDRLCSRCLCPDASACYYLSGGECVMCEESAAIAFFVVMAGFLVVTGVFFTLPLGAVILVLGEIAVTGVLAFSGFMPWTAFISSAWMLLLVSAMGDRINSAALKTLVTYYQFCALLINPSFWPASFPGGGDDGTTAMLASLECIDSIFASAPEWKYILSMSLPLFLVALVLVFSIIGSGIRHVVLSALQQRKQEAPSESTRGLLEEEEAEEESKKESMASASTKESPVNSYTLRAVLFIAYTSYLTVTTAVLTILQPCDEDGYAVFSPWMFCSWDNSEYVILLTGALVFGLLYVLGIPLCFALLLHRYRKQLHSDSAVGKAVEFLHEEFRPQMYYYELVWMARRLLLAMGIMIIPSDTPWQYGFCACVICVSLFLQSVNHPFIHRFDNFIEILAMLGVLILYSISQVVVLMGVENYPGFANFWSEVYLVILLGLLFLTFAPLLLSRFEWYNKWRNSMNSSATRAKLAAERELELSDVVTPTINLNKYEEDIILADEEEERNQ